MEQLTFNNVLASLPSEHQISLEFCCRGMVHSQNQGVHLKYYYYQVDNIEPSQLSEINIPGYDQRDCYDKIFASLQYTLRAFAEMNCPYFPRMKLFVDPRRHRIIVLQEVYMLETIEITKELLEFIKNLNFQYILPNYTKSTIYQEQDGYPMFTDFFTDIELALLNTPPGNLKQWMLCSFAENDTFEGSSYSQLETLCSDEEELDSQNNVSSFLLL